MPCYKPILGAQHEKNKGALDFREKTLAIVHSQSPPGWKLLQVPCGKCVGCLLRRSADWSQRCVHELRYHTSSCFITLTYDREHLPPDRGLNRKHLQLFFKLLRHKTKQKLKYFACGEYGDKRGRPHYHAIVFGHDFVDKRLIPNNPNSIYPLYHSAELDATWKMGQCTLGTVTSQSADYVARYTLKKAYGKKRDPTLTTIEPYSTMSKGIGERYFHDFKADMYPSDYIVDETTKQKRTVPRYYDKLLEKHNDLDLLSAMKTKRKLALQHDRNRDFTGLRLATREEVRILKIRALQRDYDRSNP